MEIFRNDIMWQIIREGNLIAGKNIYYIPLQQDKKGMSRHILKNPEKSLKWQ